MKNYYELNVNTVFDYLQDKLNFFESSAKPVCKEIGDGNLNLVFHLVDESSGKSVIVKQALTYLRAAGEDWPLDIGRSEIESKLLKLEHKLTDGLTPEIYLYDNDMACIVMEDLSDYVIMRTGLMNAVQYPNFSDQITDFLVKSLLLTSDVVMGHREKKAMVVEFINPELCEITEDLVYTEPFFEGRRNNTEEFLKEFVKEQIIGDEKLRLEAAKLKFEFMEKAQALLHGDFHTGSFFVNEESTKVIDPEFAFYGPIAYDIGPLVANLTMNYLSTIARIEDRNKKQIHLDWLIKTIEECIDMFSEKFLRTWAEKATDDMAKIPGVAEWYLNDILVGAAGVTGCEMIRRTVGFAGVLDLNNISDDNDRKKAKTDSLKIAKELIMNRQNIISGKDYTAVIKSIAQ